MTNHQVLATAILAGAACSAAFAQQDRGTRLRYGGRITPVAMIVNGVSYPVNSSQTDVVDIVYDNGVTAPPAGAFNTASLPRSHVMDDFSFNPGPGAGHGNHLTSMVVALGSTTATLPNDAVALRVQIWDTVNALVTPITADNRMDVTYVFAAPATGWAVNTYYVSNPIDLTTLPSGGPVTTDDAVWMDQSFLTTMLDPGGQPVPTTTPHPDFTGVFADISGPVVSVGSSALTYYRDANGDGAFTADELRQFNGTPQPAANLIAQLSGEPGSAPPAGCYANCDHSTTVPFLNVLDFNCFLNAFSSGQTYANCDNSTTPPVLNVLDFNCFLNKFSLGCSAP